MSIKISVVIPMYNGKNKILHCLKQLNNQSFNQNFEVLVIDDASSDGSADIVRKFIEDFKRKDFFKVIECKKNGRAGKARNIGIKTAKGQYILFVDQDDYPDIKLLEELYNLTDDGIIDCVSCNVLDKNNQLYERPHIDKADILNNSDKKNLIRNHGYVFAMLIRREIIINRNLYFPENLMFEDVLYNIGIFSCIQTFRHTNRVLYFRETDDNSQTLNLDLKKLEDRIASAKWYISNFAENKNVNKFWNEVMDSACYYIYISCVYWMLFNKNLYSYGLFLNCRKWVIENKIKWKRVFQLENRFSYIKLLMLKFIYNFPVLFPVFHFICRIYSYLKRLFKNCLK